MLARFQSELETRGVSRVQLQQADVLGLETLPSSWKDYDLIISASMLEYLAKEDLPRALAGLHGRPAPDGYILIVITRKTPETKVLNERAIQPPWTGADCRDFSRRGLALLLRTNRRLNRT